MSNLKGTIVKKLMIVVSYLAFQLLYAADLGVNYDPVHSFDFAKGVGLDDKNIMSSAIENDLNKLKELRQANSGKFASVNRVKTFFSQYSSLGVKRGRVTVNFADVANQWNQKNPDYPIKIALGVYEFRPERDSCPNQKECAKWTQDQVNAAIDAANKYGPALVDRIIVGNENIMGGDPDVPAIRNRMLVDIKTIKSKIPNTIKVGTAQRTNDVLDMVKNPNSLNRQLAEQVDFIGANVYPYWARVDYAKAKNFVAQYWNDLEAVKQNHKIITTEEGWPSAGDKFGNAIPNAANAYDYVTYWIGRDNQVLDMPASYYFALFDKLPGAGTESHWGIYSADRNASLLDGDHSKPLSAKTKLITFNNTVDKKVIINACTNDMINNQQGDCYPIYGFAGTGQIPANDKLDLMIDTSTAYYKSLLVIFEGDNNQYPRLCYLNSDDLNHLEKNVTLRWVNAQGNVVCGQ